MNTLPAISHEEISQRAQAIWEQRGRPEGEDANNWLQAERELQQERSQAAEVERGLSPSTPSATPPGKPPRGKKTSAKTRA
jgi:hypothetical protein